MSPNQPNKIDPQTNVVLSIHQMLGGIAGLVILAGGVLWTVLAFTIGGLRDDVSGIRSDVGTLRTDVEKAPKELSDAQLALTKDISGLRVDLADFKEGFKGDLKTIQISLDDIKERLPPANLLQKGKGGK